MNGYIPLSSFDGLPNVHDPVPSRDPWFPWGIAAAPVPVLIALVLFGGSSYLGPTLIVLAVVAGTAATGVWLARLDQAAIAQRGETHLTSPWLAIAPAAYLLVRAGRRAAGPHRGNPLWPLVANLALGFVTSYYVLLYLAAILSTMVRYL